MNLSEASVAAHQVEVLHGGDVESTGRLLSVAEIQHMFRELGRPRVDVHLDALDAPEMRGEQAEPHTRGDAAGPGDQRGDTRPGEESLGVDTAPASRADWADTAEGLGDAGCDGGRLDSGWIAVVAAHAGAGASTVALAITDVLSADDRPARLVDSAHPARSGLVAASSAELGTDPSGAWRRGSRQLATVFRRASDLSPHGWPDPGTAGRPVATVVDLGLPALGNLRRLAADQPSIVVVCRPTIPGVRSAEGLLAELGPACVVLAALGPRRWAGAVMASLGPGVRALRDAGQVVAIAEDRHLQVTGPTHARLPKKVTAAGRELLALIDTARLRDAPTSDQVAPSVPQGKGTTR